jgi:hypothetical protein
MSAPKLTAAQIAALKSLAVGPSSSWAFGSTTVNRLRNSGLCENWKDDYGRMQLAITDAGRAALAAHEKEGGK